MFRKLCLLLLSTSILTACTSVDITSNKDLAYNKKLDRIVIVDKISSEPIFSYTWKDNLPPLYDALTKRGLSIHVIIPRKEIQSEKGKDLKEAIEAFKPAQIMELTPLSYRGNTKFQEYKLQVSIIDVALMRPIWKSSIELSNNTPFRLSEKFSRELIKKLEEDGLLFSAKELQTTRPEVKPAQ